MNGCCGMCRYWDEDAVTREDLGWCRKVPPRVVGPADDSATCWPVTEDVDWCGDYVRDPVWDESAPS